MSHENWYADYLGIGGYLYKKLTKVKKLGALLLFKVKVQGLLKFFLWPRNYKMHKIRFVELLKTFKMTYGRMFDDKN